MSAQTMEKVVVKAVFDPGARMTACDFLAAKSGLSKGRVKDAMNKGAAWIRKKGGGMRRLRRATALPDAGDRLELYYDGKLLSVKPPAAKCLSDKRRYSVWYKPAGLLAQGTMYGDHCSLERQAELFFKSAREVYLVHRLDREAEGLMLLAHDKNAAARLSELFQKDMIAKKYRLEVLGDLAVKGKQGTIELPLDGKHALSMYEVESYHRESNTTTV
ncbi:MAG TPA: pseudouridine synthase, partial [Dissulfurispiraceae bacterium]